MTSTTEIKRIIREPMDWAKGSVCEECCLPLCRSMDTTTFTPTDGERFVRKLYCDLHAEEFGMRDDAE
jgi:hypothetical protein